jgi:hypothetical protein
MKATDNADDYIEANSGIHHFLKTFGILAKDTTERLMQSNCIIPLVVPISWASFLDQENRTVPPGSV